MKNHLQPDRLPFLNHRSFGFATILRATGITQVQLASHPKRVTVGVAMLGLLGVWLLPPHPAYARERAAAATGRETGVSASVYYVDFEHGTDDHDGRSPRSAYQHCPGDPAATGNARSTTLVPGATVVFKGGVAYRGSITIQQSGAEGKPITYDGNSQGQFGTGRAVLDGSELMTGWRRCASAEECGGNLNWKQIWYAESPFPTDPFLANLYEVERPLAIAQDPNLTDSFNADSASDYRDYDGSKASPTTLEDAVYLTQKDPRVWDGAYVALWAVPNYVYFQKVTGYEPAGHKIVFEKLPTAHYTDRPGKYSMLNAFPVLDRPGEFVVRMENGRYRIYVWPSAGGEARPSAMTISRHPFGFNLQGHSYLTIEGFTIQKFISRAGHRGAGITSDEGEPRSLVIRNNVITGCSKDPGSGWKHAGINLADAQRSLVEGNQVCENRCGGIFILGGLSNVVKKNVIRRNSVQGLWLMGVKDSQVIGNEVLDNLGAHSNGISVYAGAANILVFGNRVFNSNIAFTTERSSNVTVACNVFYTPRFYAVADWGGSKALRLFHNVLLRDDHSAGAVLSIGPGTSAVHTNNIFVGKGAGLSRDDHHNLLAGQEEISKIFLDPARRDYRLKRGSPAIDAGTEVGIKSDAIGTLIPQGKATDIGAYEYVQ